MVGSGTLLQPLMHDLVSLVAGGSPTTTAYLETHGFVKCPLNHNAIDKGNIARSEGAVPNHFPAHATVKLFPYMAT